MPRFFFQIYDNGREFIDAVGVDCADLNEAKHEAIASAGELLRGRARATWIGSTWLMRVQDEQRNTVYKLSFIAE